MLSNAYFLAKFRFDTAENEPAKNLQIFRKCIFRRCIFVAKFSKNAFLKLRAEKNAIFENAFSKNAPPGHHYRYADALQELVEPVNVESGRPVLRVVHVEDVLQRVHAALPFRGAGCDRYT